ncbi:DUF3800 domain-containing protein [Enterococcus dispar]|jgi:hypothetical protein|uniref:DUF3800 domain-containing protein n=1 Tax=Enterococcus dispar TaxID=44009 RepID=UPI00232C21C6|nr:DUF3800 domain-containing protein [Enterococcus dispar]WCG32634.1 DUF3800 domain-containing protein [Enterococcus dispar]
MKLYIDESGSITSDNFWKNRFFTIGYIENRDNFYRVARTFKKSKINYLKHNPNCRLSIKDELKGSDMSNDMKLDILGNVASRCNLGFNYMIFDNQSATDRLRKNPSITFNYLVGISTKKILTNSTDRTLNLHLDNRNCSVYNLKSLEDYLKIELIAKAGIADNVTVQYHESENNELVQIADIFSNSVHRLVTYHNSTKYFPSNIRIHDLCSPSYKDFFPMSACDFDFVR